MFDRSSKFQRFQRFRLPIYINTFTQIVFSEEDEDAILQYICININIDSILLYLHVI
jgi:hypothetical protein